MQDNVYKDKNGRVIKINDIVEAYGVKFSVELDINSNLVFRENIFKTYPCDKNANNVKVIGNCIDNPDLLRK